MSSATDQLPDFAFAMPGLLRGNLAQVAEITLFASASGLSSCQFAVWLLMKEARRSNDYSVMERHRIKQIEELCANWLNINSVGIARQRATACKILILYALAKSVSNYMPHKYRESLYFASLYLLTLEVIFRESAETEIENVA